MVLIMAHIGGCGFYQIGRYDNFYKKYNWLLHNDMLEKPIWEKYITSIYFTFISMITVGYGDIYPVSVNEKIYVIFMAIISGGIFGYCVNKISSIFGIIHDKKQQIEHQQEVITQYCRSRNVSQYIQLQILRYVEYHNDDNSVEDEGNLLIQKLNPSILGVYKTGYYGKILKQKKIFSQNFSEDTLNKCAQKMEEKIYKKGQTVFNINDHVDKLFLIESGSIQFYRINDETQQELDLGHVKQGRFLGLNAFFGDSIYQNSARCLEDCRLIFIEKKEFLSIIKDNQIDREKYQNLKDQINIEQHDLIQGQCCHICKVISHDRKDCPNLHLKINHQLVIRKHQYSVPILHRNKYYARKSFKSYALIDHQENREYLKMVRLDYLEILHGYSIEEDQQEYCMKNFQDHKSDIKFFQYIPKLKENKVDNGKFKKLQLIITNINELEEDTDKYNMEILKLQNQQQPLSEDDSEKEEEDLLTNFNQKTTTDQRMRTSQLDIQQYFQNRNSADTNHTKIQDIKEEENEEDEIKSDYQLLVQNQQVSSKLNSLKKLNEYNTSDDQLQIQAKMQLQSFTNINQTNRKSKCSQNSLQNINFKYKQSPRKLEKENSYRKQSILIQQNGQKQSFNLNKHKLSQQQFNANNNNFFRQNSKVNSYNNLLKSIGPFNKFQGEVSQIYITQDLDLWLNTAYYLDNIKECLVYRVHNNASVVIQKYEQLFEHFYKEINEKVKKKIENQKNSDKIKSQSNLLVQKKYKKQQSPEY